MRKPVVIAAVVIASLFVFSAAKDLIVKISVEKGVEMVTGLKISIKSFNVGIFKSAVRIKGLKVYNPKTFKDRTMVDMPEIYVNYDLPAVLFGKIHLRALRLHLKEFVVVKNEKGELNLNSLKVVKSEKSAASPSGGAKKNGLPPIQIDDMHLKIEKALYKNYSAGASPSVKEFNVNIDDHYTNVTNPYAIVSLIVVKSLANTSIAGAANFDIGPLTDSVQGTLSTANTAVAKTAETIKQTQEALKKTSETLGGLFK